jgi:serine/threonine-protein kinase
LPVGDARVLVGGARAAVGARRGPSGGGRARFGARRGPSGGGREPSSPADSAIFRPGALCGGDRYRIVELISCGGFAEIYAARDVRDEAPRAIKVLQARHQANEQAMGRLLREARAGVSLVHPNLVRVYDAGIDVGSGALYVAMELLEGHTLRDLLIAHRQMEPLVALQWAAELADAVHVLNELGIIHRDLKPENIFVTVDGVLKVLDLGNIRLERVGLKTTLGPITGTALYMSPEHIRGEKVDRRTDVYALALITYECLAGIHPLLVGASVMPTMMEITSWQLLKEIEPLTTLLPKLPSALWRALKQALHKERGERLGSAAELAIHLRAVQDAMATAQGARARVPAMTVAVVRSTGAHPQAQPFDRAAPPPVAMPGGPQAEPSSLHRASASAVTDRGTQVIDPSGWSPEEAARDARPALAAPRAGAVAAAPSPAQARHAATASSAATLRLARPPGGPPRAAAAAAPSQTAGPAPMPRWLLPLGAVVAFTAALGVTLWLASSSGARGTAEPRASARPSASAPPDAGVPAPEHSAGDPADGARDGGAAPATGPGPKPLFK